MSKPLPSHSPIDADLLDRYLARLTTPAEDEIVQRWITAHPDHATVVDALRTAPLQTDLAATTDTEVWLERLELQNGSLRLQADFPRPVTQTAESSPSPNHTISPLRPRESSARRTLRQTKTLWTAAAAVVGAALVIVTHNTLRPWLSQLGLSSAPRVAVYSTGNGERANITLPDGSVASLNVASRLEVPTTFGVGNRTLHLSGEALFTVAHHDGAPFTVVTQRNAIRVLGTMFAVRQYATDTNVTVIVREGKVSVQSHVIAAHQQAVVDDRGVVHVQPADLAALSFANGVLTLDDIPLRDAVVDLDRWYDADIRIPDPKLASARIRASFAAGSLTDLGSMLEFMFGVKVVRDGRILTLTSKD